jgi:hypothetical protein
MRVSNKFKFRFFPFAFRSATTASLHSSTVTITGRERANEDLLTSMYLSLSLSSLFLPS